MKVCWLLAESRRRLDTGGELRMLRKVKFAPVSVALRGRSPHNETSQTISSLKRQETRQLIIFEPSTQSPACWIEIYRMRM